MSQSAKNILISVAVGLILFLILAIGYNLKLIPISINVSNTINSIQKQVDQIGIEFLGQIQIERAKMKDLVENSFIVDTFDNQVITDKVYSEVYEYTIRNKNCYGITFVNNDKTIFFVYPPYASKRKGMVLATEYFNHFLTKEYLILPFQTTKEAQSTDEIVLGYPVQKNGKMLGLALFHYSGTSLLTEPIKKSTLSIKGLAFVKAYNMIIFNIPKEILDEKDRLSDILATIENDSKTIGPAKVGNNKYYFFINQIGNAGKQVVIVPNEKVGTPLIVQIVISFYLITIIILITYVLLAFFFTPKEEEIELKGQQYYKKPEEYQEIKNMEEEEEFLSAVSSEEKKKDFFFEEVKAEKPIDTALKSLVEEVSQKKSPLEVSLEEEYVFAPHEDLASEELPEVDTTQKEEKVEIPEFPIEKGEENIELPNIEEEEEVIIEKDFEKKEGELPTLEELEESKEEYKGLEIKEESLELPEEVLTVSEEMKTLEEESPSEAREEAEEEALELPKIDEETFEEESKQGSEEFEIPPLEEFSGLEEEKIETQPTSEVINEEFEFTELPNIEEEPKQILQEPENLELPEEVTSIPEEMKPLEEMEMPEIFEEEKGIEKLEEIPEMEVGQVPEVEGFEEEKPEQILQEPENLELPEEVTSIPEEMKPLEEMEIPEIFEEEKGIEKLEEIPEMEVGQVPEVESFEEEKPEQILQEPENLEENLEIPTIEELDQELPSEEIPTTEEGIEGLPEGIIEEQPIGSIAEELQTEEEVGEKISEEESEFFSDISSDDISLSAEELENVTKEVDNTIDTENVGESIEDLELPQIGEEEFNDFESKTSAPVETNLPYDDLCKSFVSKYNVDAIAFFKSEMDIFTCGGASDSRFANIQFEVDEPIIEKLSSLRKDIFIPEGINKFQPLLQKDQDLFSGFNSMYIHGIFDEGQLLGAIFIFTNLANQKDKEEYYHIATKLAELIS